MLQVTPLSEASTLWGQSRAGPPGRQLGDRLLVATIHSNVIQYCEFHDSMIGDSVCFPDHLSIGRKRAKHSLDSTHRAVNIA